MDDTKLDGLAVQAIRWQKVLIENFAKIATLHSEKNDLMRSVSEVEEQLRTSKSESAKLLGQVGDLQKIIAQRCDFQAENGKLKDQITEREKKFEADSKESHGTIAELQEEIKTRELEFTKQISELETKLKAEASKEKSALEQTLETKRAEMVDLRKLLRQQETEHQQEMAYIKKMYEESLAKMKDQTTTLQNSASYNACKELFRKKWEYAKSQYESEINSLRGKIKILEGRLGRWGRTKPQGIQPRPQPAPRPTPGSGVLRGNFKPTQTSTKPAPQTEGPPSKKLK